jgi:diacylglycerol O-acyltransferase
MSSLVAERGPVHVHVGATMLMEGEAPQLEELLEHVDGRLHLVPRFRQRVTPTPLQLTNPKWADDPDFDLRWHVRQAALPRPGTLDQLRDHVGHVMSEPLDFDRPLWQLHLIEGVEGGRHAYISRRAPSCCSWAPPRSGFGPRCEGRGGRLWTRSRCPARRRAG